MLRVTISTVTFAFVALLLTACGDSQSEVEPSNLGGGAGVAKVAITALQYLHDIEDVRGEFRRNVGSTGIVLLVSPT